MARHDGTENLIPANRQSKEQARENGRKGGIASGESKRAKKSMREMAELVLAAPVPVSKKLEEQMQQFGFEPTEANIQLMSLLAVAKNATKGDLASLTFLRDTNGERPIDKMDLKGTLNGDINITIGGESDDD